MIHSSDTPPHGDFARYVEQLTAQTGAGQRAPRDEHLALDVGMAPSPQPTYGREGGIQDQLVFSPDAAGNSVRAPVRLPVFKVLAGVWVLALLVAWAIGASGSTLFAIAAIGLWAGWKSRNLALGGGIQKWQKLLEETSRREQMSRKNQKR